MALLNATIGEIIVGKPPDQLQAVALGSCIGLVVYDKTKKIACLAHILLPEKNKFSKPGSPGKFAPDAVPEAIKQVLAAGGTKANIVAKLAGGAKMFNNFSSDVNDIGLRNEKATLAALKENGITVLSKDTGNNYGRTILFDTETLMLHIKQAKENIVKKI